jgi:3-phenylpropionate/cinnamic acid dioxygenase small subunit
MNVDDGTYLGIQQFLAHEAHLLDDGNWSEWLELYVPGAIYWMPLDAAQTDLVGHASLLCDDAILRELRCRRWAERTTDLGALSLQPPPRTIRHLSNLTVTTGACDEALTARAGIMLAEHARGEVRTHHAHARWRLMRTAGGLRIAEKRVDLLNASGPLSDILTYL